MVNGKRDPSTSSGQAVRSERREARSEKKRTNNNTPRILQIHPSHRGECISKYVFCKENGERFTGDYVSKTFKQACKDAGMDNAIHFHSLRHSFASNLVQKGVNLYTIKELLGHSSIATTEIYSHLNMDSLKDAIRMFDESKIPHLSPLLLKERKLRRVK
jgi:integrase/recombinase XerD